MGNLSSCFCVKLKTARLIDFHGNIRHIKVPTTAAEIMLLEQPGNLVSLVPDDLRSNFRLSALRADQVLTNGRLYLLIPVGRLNSFTTDLELEMLRLGCKRVKKVKRRRDIKVVPEENGGGDTVEVDGGEAEGEELTFTGQGVSRSPVWKPPLEPIYE